MEINIVQLLTNLSRGLDCSGQGLLTHHQHVAFMSMKLGKAAGLGDEAILELFKAAIIHDIGAISWEEKKALQWFDFENMPEHCMTGYRLLRGSCLSSSAPIVRTHHDRWNGGNRSGFSKDTIPLASRIIHLADRVDILIREDIPILDQRNEIMSHIREFSGIYFDPELVSLLQIEARNESFWLAIITPWVLEKQISELIPYQKVAVKMTAVYSIAELFAKIIDSMSPFTYRHSNDVAAAARFLAVKLGLSREECNLIEIAALLHDIGKLTVPVDILHKPGPLTSLEFNVIKQHPFYTYSWLKPAMTFAPIAEWAAYHHEQLNGNGYPFHKTADELDVQARIISVSDIFSALHEDRPYRQRLTLTEIEIILNDMIKAGAIDNDIVAILRSNLDELDTTWSELTSSSVKARFLMRLA